MRRERRTKEQWEAIFLAQQSSGITAREYCAKHNIHHKTFSARKSGFKNKTERPISKLVKVVKANPESKSTTPTLTVVYHGVTLNVGKNVEAKWLADVMKALAS
ncbi:hypothetical protein Q4602_22060 [Paraglaciecola chathamensis]|nr:hypothetical protein [Paraglaciecola chathamensis]MDO6842164.1 hypothetical protein [Paraglaciecola chathamensis]|tara:strand:+ start:248 stop:559 length:312 start_codon:yes stop_codon:yes gene_type:complete